MNQVFLKFNNFFSNFEALGSLFFRITVGVAFIIYGLGKFPLPVEVIPLARSSVARQLVKLGGRPVLRQEFTTDNGNIILGYSTINTNRISMKVDCKCDGDVAPISFSAKYLKEILNANRNSKSATLKISSQGLAHIQFETDNITSKYYLVEIK